MPAFAIARFEPAPGTVNLARIVAAAILALAAFAAAAQGVEEASEAAIFGTLPAEARAADEAKRAELRERRLARERRDARLSLITRWTIVIVGCAGVGLVMQPEFLVVTCMVPLGLTLDLDIPDELVELVIYVVTYVVVYCTLTRNYGPEGPRTLLESWLARRERRLRGLQFKRGAIVSFDDDGISAQLPFREAEAIAWAEVQRIALEWVDSNPAGACLWWLLEGEGKRCAFPRGARGEREVRAVLAARFPGFSRDAVDKAKHARSEAPFVCWERSAAGQDGPAQTTARRRARAPAHAADATP